MSGSNLGPGREFDAIRQLLSRLGDAATGIGDDAAILDVPRGDHLVVSNDSCVEGRHFREGWLTPEEIGYRAVTAALSDLAAMAARPLGVLWAIDLPDRWRQHLPALADGARAAAAAATTKIVGGNLSSANELSIATTVLGSALTPLRRTGAARGDKVYVTGVLGGPALALAALSAGTKPNPDHRARFARPVARIDEARWLVDRGASAGLDISDALAGDVRHLAAASGVGVTIHLDRLPCVSGADAMTAVRSGEEYELLVTAPAFDAKEFAGRFGIALTEIGEITMGSAVTFMSRGSPVDVGRGHDHLS